MVNNPFSAALLRYCLKEIAPTSRFADFELDTSRHSLIRAGAELKIGSREFATLAYLVVNAGRTCSRDEIIDHVWKGVIVGDNSLEKTITALRKILGDSARDPKFIKTVHGTGYLFIGEVTTVDQSDDPKNTKVARAGTRVILMGTLIAGILAVMLVAGFAVKRVWARLNTHVLFADDFTDEQIDQSRWEMGGNRVWTENGILHMRVEETDRWGRLFSAPVRFDPQRPVTITARMKVMYSENLKNESYFHGHFGFQPAWVNDEFIRTHITFFGVKYANFDYKSYFADGSVDEQPAEGFFLVRDGADPTRKLDLQNGRVSPRITPVWDRWFVQTLTWDPVSGKLEYFIDGVSQGVLEEHSYPEMFPTPELRLDICPEGWWLYHSIDIDEIQVTQ